MIRKIYGEVDYVGKNYAVVETGKIGYQVFFNEVSLGKLAADKNKEFEIFTYTYVREDQLSLFGFLSKEELEMFELLLSINGIGPRAALGILNIADPKMIRSAISKGDSSILTKVSGVGKKTAERVVMELQNKIEEMPEAESQEAQSDQDVVDALLSMGYSISEARQAAGSVPKKIEDVSERIREALKAMKK